MMELSPTTNHEHKLIDELVKKKSTNSRAWAEALMNGHFSISKEVTEDDLNHVQEFFFKAMMVAMNVAYEKVAAEGKKKSEGEPVYLTTPDGFADFTDDEPDEQADRINNLGEAIKIYKQIKPQGILGTSNPMAVSDIIILAEYIRKGSEKP